MKTRWTFGALFVAALLALPAVLAEEGKEAEKDKDEVNLEEIKCPISGRAVDAERTVAHKDAKVYFCCPNCVKAFEKDPKNEKFAAKVNYQLVATKQAKQKACPISGQDLGEDTEVEVGYAKLAVGFCCQNCQKKAKSLSEEEDKLIALIFGDEEKFTKAFKIGEDDEEEDEDEEEED